MIENRPGPGSIVGTKAAVGAPPDGYTLLFGASGSMAVTPALYKNAGYDPVKSFAPVAALSQGALGPLADVLTSATNVCFWVKAP